MKEVFIFIKILRKDGMIMKSKRRFLALILALAMVFTFSIPTAVFAMDDGTAQDVAIENEADTAKDDSKDASEEASKDDSKKDVKSSVESKKTVSGEASKSKAKKAAMAPRDAEENTVYVSENPADDESAELGSEANPYKSLQEAVDAVDEKTGDEYVIEILSDLTATKCARINGKDIILKGNGHTITRGENFSRIQDNARSTYNPAIIEVCNSGSRDTASLRLENITISDNCLTEGEWYLQASTDGTGQYNYVYVDKDNPKNNYEVHTTNSAIVQDAIIATYDGVGTITLGEKAVLDGYGGMSSVRLSGGTLVMESGSKITGGKKFGTNEKGEFGAAGAIWSQGGKITINEGAEISEIMGRAIYLDGNGSEALVNGTISGVTPNANMWQGTDGTAMHVRNESKAVLGSTGKITNIDGGSAAICIFSSSFTAQKDSKIFGIKNTRIANANTAKEEDRNPHVVLFDGVVRDCTYGDVQFWSWYARYIVGSNAVIENTTASKRSIGMFYLQNGGELNVEGKIQNNNNTVVYMGNQGGSGTVVRVKDGAYIHNNGGYGVYANNSGKVDMSGGEISENSSYGIYVRSKNNWKDANLTMTGGKIINNKSTGIQYVTIANSKYSKINISGGEISGNGSSFSPNQISISGENAEDTLSRVYIKPGVVKAANDRLDSINTSFATITDINLGDGNEDFYIGNAKSTASNELKNQVKSFKEDETDVNEYAAKGYALWFKNADNKLSFDASRYYGINKALPLYVAYLPLKADGTPEDGAKASFKKVNNAEVVNVELEDLTKDQPYALMWMQPTEKFGTLVMEGTPQIEEELDKTEYSVDYKATYTLTDDIAGLVEEGDEFKFEVTLDDRLSYDESMEGVEAVVAENDAMELAGSEYNAVDNNVIFTLKIKEGFTPKKNTDYTVNISFKAKAVIDDFNAKNLSSDAAVKGSVKLSGDILKTDFVLNTLSPVETKLVPLPTYTVTYDFVSGTTGRSLPNAVLGLKPKALKYKQGSDVSLIAPRNTVVNDVGGRWTFDGYDKTEINDITEDVTITGRWTFSANPVTPTIPTTPVTPTTPTAGGGGAAVAAALVAVADGATPLANIEADTGMREIDDEDTPLSKGPAGHWALLNLILAIFTALVSVLLLVFYFKNKNADDDEEVKRMGIFRMLSIVSAIAAVALFILTEDMSLPMAITDKWTLLMAVFALFNVVFAFLAKKQTEEDEAETV